MPSGIGHSRGIHGPQVLSAYLSGLKINNQDAGVVAKLSSPNVGCSVFGNQLATASASASIATTYEMLRWVPAGRKPIAGRLRYRHNRTTGPHAQLQFMVGSCTSTATGSQNLVPVTWNNGQSVVPASAVSAVTFEQDVLSDIFPITLVNRTDSFEGWIQTLRTLIPIDASTGVYSYTNAATNGSPNSTGLKAFGTRQQNVDGVTGSNQANFTQLGINAGSVSVVDIEYYYEDSLGSLFHFGGDSTYAGEFSTTGYDGWTRRLTENLNTAGFNLSYWNGGWGSQTSATNLKAFKQILNLLKPRYAMYQCASSNDGGGSAALLALQKAQAIDAVESARANGAIPFLSTYSPNNARDSTLAAHMLALNSWVVSYCAFNDIGCANVGLYAGDPTDNTLFLNGYAANDLIGGKHPNDPGYAAIANGVFNDIRRFL